MGIYLSINQVRQTDFELFAADITKMLLKDVVEIDVTRPCRDGYRDAIGKMRVGQVLTYQK